MTREEVLREKMQQLIVLLRELSALSWVNTSPTPAYWEKGLNVLFDSLHIPAEVVGWWDGSDGEHVPCSLEGCRDLEPCEEFEELAGSPNVERFDVGGNILLVRLY